MFDGQRLIPAIGTHQDMKKFLKLPLTYGILMNFQLAQLPDLVETMKQHGKKVLVHSELIRGLASDEFGAIYLIQTMRVAGIISSKPRVIEMCRKRGVIGIMRFFLKDSYSLKQSIKMVQYVRPDCIEVLPAVNEELLDMIRDVVTCDLIVGGLLLEEEQIRRYLRYGALAVTTSKVPLWSVDFNGI